MTSNVGMAGCRVILHPCVPVAVHLSPVRIGESSTGGFSPSRAQQPQQEARDPPPPKNEPGVLPSS